MNTNQTGYTESVPKEYFEQANNQGIVEKLEYDSLDYLREKQKIKKTTYIYLPYNYDKNKQYNIVYLMHGWGGHIGEYFEFIHIKNLIDQMIEREDILPSIFVSPTFYNENSNIDFNSSISELKIFHNDFLHHLMPAVESKYPTYANNTTDKGLQDSRDHRIFGGFSLGSVTTWLQFCHNSDYIKYFLPMSGSCWYYGSYGNFQTKRNVDYIEEIIQKNDLDKKGYKIYFTTGTNDSVKSQTLMQADEMLERSDIFTPEHFLFYQKRGGYHDFNAVAEYMYNALPLFFKDIELDN